MKRVGLECSDYFWNFWKDGVEVGGPACVGVHGSCDSNASRRLFDCGEQWLVIDHSSNLSLDILQNRTKNHQIMTKKRK